MMDNNKQLDPKVVLITGAARRIGATIARYFHARDYNVIVHYRTADTEAQNLLASLNAERPNSCWAWQADLGNLEQLTTIHELIREHWGRLDVLIHNASSFKRTHLGQVTAADWEILWQSNVKGAYFLTQELLPWLQASQQAAIVTITDIHAIKPMRDYSVYCMTKAALTMMTLALAKELAPNIRVNGVAPGIAALPENENSLQPQQEHSLLQRIPLRRFATPQDIAKAVWAFVEEYPYVTGQILAIDGGRSLNI